MRADTIRKILILTLSALILLTAASVPFTNRVNLHGGRTGTKSMAIWELYKYRDTELLRKYPLCWCPWTAYLLVNQNVTVEEGNNKYYLCINTDLYSATIDEAKYNKSHAKTYKGTDKQRVKKIYDYCRKTTYEAHRKTARDVFESRTADCAGISEAFYVMCRKNKIPVRYIIGWTEYGCHAWNRVRVKGKWYYVDATLERYLSRSLWKGYSVMETW